MLQTLIPHLRRNVVGYIALFVALGGTAMASVIITSNSQVASNTISGHKPPSGKHANLFAGSVNNQDVAANSLTGANVNESTLTGDVQHLIYTATASPNPALENPVPSTVRAAGAVRKHPSWLEHGVRVPVRLQNRLEERGIARLIGLVQRRVAPAGVLDVLLRHRPRSISLRGVTKLRQVVDGPSRLAGAVPRAG
jgi:hypothetical protein